MNRTIFSLLVLLLFGLFSQPSIAQSRQHASQRSAEENVAKMSEAEMRAHLPLAKERLKMSQSALKTGNYSKYLVGDDDISKGVSKAAAEAEYYYYTTLINEIEKRLRKIDSQKPKPQTEQQQQAETEQQQQGESEQNVEEELQKKFDKKMGELQPIFNQLHTDVDAHSDAAMNEHVAAALVRGRINTNGFTSVTTDMLDKQQLTRSNSRPNTRPNISDKIQKQKSEEPKKEEPEETPKEASNEYDEILRLINELDK